MNSHADHDDFIGALTALFHPIDVTAVHTFPHLSHVVAIVAESEVNEAIGRRGANVRRISSELRQNIEVMSLDDFHSLSTGAITLLSNVQGLTVDSARRLADNGVFDIDDLSCLEPEWLAQITGLSLDQASAVIDAALN